MYTSQGVKKQGGGRWNERDFRPQAPLTPEAEEKKIKIERKIAESLARKRMKHGKNT